MIRWCPETRVEKDRGMQQTRSTRQQRAVAARLSTQLWEHKEHWLDGRRLVGWSGECIAVYPSSTTTITQRCEMSSPHASSSIPWNIALTFLGERSVFDRSVLRTSPRGPFSVPFSPIPRSPSEHGTAQCLAISCGQGLRANKVGRLVIDERIRPRS